MLSARCKQCNVELTSTSKIIFCGCPNQMWVRDDQVGANDLSNVVLTNHKKSVKYNTILSDTDLKYQEERRKRRVKKIEFEER